MPIKVSADGLTIVTTNSEGVCVSTVPDVCYIPGPNGSRIPIPFVNKAESKDAKVTSILTEMDGGKVCCLGSYVESSTGDEGGILGGIISGGTGGKATFMLSSPTVTVEGRPVCRKSDLMIMNDINTVGLAGMNQEDVGGDKVDDLEPKTIEIKLVDDEGKAIGGEKFVIKHSGKITYEGTLDSSGYAKVENVKGSGYIVEFPDQQSAERDRSS